MIFFDILWWIACLLIAVGFYYVFLVVKLASTLDYEKDDGESAVVFIILYIRIFLFIVPAVFVLFLLWYFNLAPESFSFLGSPGQNDGSPSYTDSSGFMNYDNLYIVTQLIAWLFTITFIAGLIWTTLSGISALWKMFVNYKNK